jgi:uncharacterized glyoxalase superfamily protein PhnB
MTPSPPGWPRFVSAVVYRDAAEAIDWLCAAFGFQIRIKVEGENGRIEHCELEYGEGLIMIAQEKEAALDPRGWRACFKSPKSVGGTNTQSLIFFVDDADAHCAQARARGARIVEEPAVHDYGEEYFADKSYGAFDPEGHLWWITQRLRTAR